MDCRACLSRVYMCLHVSKMTDLINPTERIAIYNVIQIMYLHFLPLPEINQTDFREYLLIENFIEIWNLKYNKFNRLLLTCG